MSNYRWTEEDAKVLQDRVRDNRGGKGRERPPENAQSVKTAKSQRIIALILPYPPALNTLYINVRGKGRIMSEKGKQFKEDVKAICWQARLVPTERLVSVSLHIYRPRKIGDIDSVIKISLDSIQGFAYMNDSQIIELHAYRLDDKTNPRIEMEIIEI